MAKTRRTESFVIGRERWRFGTHPARRTSAVCPVGGASTWPALAGLLATILAAWIDFVPGPVLVVVSALLAVPTSWQLYRYLYPSGAQRHGHPAIHVSTVALLFTGTWSMLAVFLPLLPTLLGGTLVVERHVVSARPAVWPAAICRSLELQDLGWPVRRGLCVGEAVWRSSEPGQAMAVRLTRSPFGALVHEMEPVCDGFVEQHLAAPASTPLFSPPN
jgi:hypothetical protein